jgi:hypothetical protein
MRRWLLPLYAAAVMCACEESKAKEDTPMTQGKAPTTAELAQLRTEVLAAVKPFGGHPEYAVDDPEVVDPCIADRMRGLGDRMPTASERASFVRDAAVCVQNRLTEPDGLARVAKRIEARYRNPVITRDGDRVTIDAGVVAGKLHVHRAGVEVFDTDLVDMGEWATTEVVRFLKLAIARYPDARVYVARVEIPAQGKAPELLYVFDRSEDRIRVTSQRWPKRSYVTEKLGGDVGSAQSLLTARLHGENVEAAPPWR